MDRQTMLIVESLSRLKIQTPHPGGKLELISSPMLSLTVISATLAELTASWRVRDMVSLMRMTSSCSH